MANEETTRSTESEAWRGKVGVMDDAEIDAFLALGNLARLAVLDDKGWPYVQPVWFQWDPIERIYWVIARKKSQWAEHMKRDGRVALSIDGSEAPYPKVTAQGIAEIVEEPNVGGKWVEIANEMAVRYLGEHGPDYLVPTLDKPRWLIRIVPTEMSSWQGVDWHPRYKD